LSYQNKDWLDVFSTVRTPRVLAPQKVKHREEMLAQHLGEPVHLFVRRSLTKDVTAANASYPDEWSPGKQFLRTLQLSEQ
jgi:hypothetical protein